MKVTTLATLLGLGSQAVLGANLPNGVQRYEAALVARQQATKSGASSSGPTAKPMSFDEAWKEISKQKVLKQQGDGMKIKFDLKAECKRCSGNQVPDKKDKDGKCKDCPKGQKPDKDNTKCLRDDTGCAEDEVQKDDKSCGKCDGDKIADSTGKKCVDRTSGNKQGKCPEGQILNPAKGGQDENTEKPSCIPDDDSKCPPGEVAATRSKSQQKPDSTIDEPSCGKDDNPDFRCDDKSLYDHKETDVDGKIKHSCRSTDDKEKGKKDKVEERRVSAGDKKETEKKEKDNKRKRTRAGWCWVELASMTAFGIDEVDAMTEEEIDGMIDLAMPDVPEPYGSGDGSIPDYTVYAYRSVSICEITVGGCEAMSAAAGVPGLSAWTAIPRAVQAARGGAQAAAKYIKEVKTGSRAPAAAKAIEKAKNSNTVQKILKDDRFKDCIASTAAVVASNIPEKNIKLDIDRYHLDVDWSRKEIDSSAAPPDRGEIRIKLQEGRHNDNLFEYHPGNAQETKTSTSSRVVPGRLQYEVCQKVEDRVNNKISWAEVWGGCCSFYDDDKCEQHMFTMENREHKDIRGKHNDAISSMWCTFATGCKGAPNMG